MYFQFNLYFYRVIPATQLCKKCPYSKFSGPYFPTLGEKAEICFVNFRIQSECGKMLTKKTLNTDTFYAVQLIVP